MDISTFFLKSKTIGWGQYVYKIYLEQQVSFCYVYYQIYAKERE